MNMTNKKISILDLYGLQNEVEWNEGFDRKFKDFLFENDRLFNIISKISYKATTGVAATLTELIQRKILGCFPNIDCNQFALKIEALWAGAIDPLYLKTFKFGYEYDDEDEKPTPFSSNWFVLIFFTKKYMEGSFYIHHYLMNLSMLARHLMPNKRLFDKWFAETMDKTAETFPCSYDYDDLDMGDTEARYDCSDDAPVLREFFFDPEFQYSEEAAKPLLNTFLQSLDYNNNPWICTPEEMLEKGFKGTPYTI